jgi:dCMP deaminase
MSKIVIVYIPVLHEGYRKLLNLHKDADTVFVWGKELISESNYLQKEIRALEPELIVKSLENWGFSAEIKILDLNNLKEVVVFNGKIILPDDDISHLFAEKYLTGKEIVYENIFLRWDRNNSVRENKIANDQVITSDEFSRKIIALAKIEAEKSSDWWRQVGAVIIKKGKILLVGHNHHVPSDQTPYIDGDPRNCFHKGEYLELSTAIHAEAGLIAEAARKGISLEDSEIYVTTFPCPPCAKLIAYSGLKRIYYKEGYGVLDGEGIMKEKGIEIIWVQ